MGELADVLLLVGQGEIDHGYSIPGATSATRLISQSIASG
jgi:hypothetical protein